MQHHPIPLSIYQFHSKEETNNIISKGLVKANQSATSRIVGGLTCGIPTLSDSIQNICRFPSHSKEEGDEWK
jgi:hypothetical protein